MGSGSYLKCGPPLPGSAVVDDLRAHRTKEQSGKTASAARTNYEEVDVLSRLEDDLGRSALFDVELELEIPEKPREPWRLARPPGLQPRQARLRTG